MRKNVAVLFVLMAMAWAMSANAWTADRIISEKSADIMDGSSAYSPEALTFFATKVAAKAQVRDPRIGQQEMLALIDMDPIDPDYRTDYSKYETGVLLVPSSGPIEGKKGWYAGLAVPAGTYMDIPKGSTKEPFTFEAPNGQKASAVKVTLPAGEDAIVNACKNRHKPKAPMIMKMVPPVIETKEIPVPTNVAVCTGGMIKNAYGRCVCPEGMTLDQNGVCVSIGGGALYRPSWWVRNRRWAVPVGVVAVGTGIYEALKTKRSPKKCGPLGYPPPLTAQAESDVQTCTSPSMQLFSIHVSF